jgi:F420-dependent oxidoreductase-like protein
MRLGIALNYSGGFDEFVEEIVDHERAGVDITLVPEAYSFDAISQLGFLAARTSRMEIASGIIPLYSRTPSLIAMTAAGLDYVSNGRFTLGLGASGPQVIEGFHGVPYDAPVGRTREVLEICRAVWRRERLVHNGKYYSIPLGENEGTGLGKPLKLINHPVRERVPVVVAANGNRNVAMAAEIADGWMPIFFYPEMAHSAWSEPLSEGRARRPDHLGELDVVVGVPFATGDDVEDLLQAQRFHLALYIGGMGAKGRNFYADLAHRYGYGSEADKIQDLYLAGEKEAAAQAVPDSLLRNVCLVGSAGFVAERLEAYREAGVTTLNLMPLEADRQRRVNGVQQVRRMLD